MAVVELFTSEGCSSCPPAERVLSAIHAAADRNGTPVYALAFHVDYWNHLGWADRFSKHEFSERQKQYAAKLQLDTIYTPQMIVNGVTQFLGSDKEAADRAIAVALHHAPEVKITAQLDSVEQKKATIQFTCDGIADGDVVNIAVVEDSLDSKVNAGENAGQSLRHDAVVRTLVTLPAKSGQQRASVDLGDAKWANASVIVFVQRQDSWTVRGAVAVKLK